MIEIRPHDRVLFQGDSITDAFRVKDPGEPHDCYLLGAGYAGRIAGDLRLAHPAAGLRFFNRGVSGITTGGLLERWPLETVALEPDVLSLLVGVNDANPDHAQDVATFEDQYRELLQKARAALPGLRLILLEPFALAHGTAGPAWRERVEQRQPVVRQLASELDAAFVPLQGALDEATASAGAPPTHWTLDGIHPSSAGHALIAREWQRAVRVAVGA